MCRRLQQRVWVKWVGTTRLALRWWCLYAQMVFMTCLSLRSGTLMHFQKSVTGCGEWGLASLGFFLCMEEKTSVHTATSSSAMVAWIRGLQVGWPRTSPTPSWQSWSQMEPTTWTYAAVTLWTPSLYSKLEPWRSASWSSGLKRPGTATEVALQQLWPLHFSWLCWE